MLHIIYCDTRAEARQYCKTLRASLPEPVLYLPEGGESEIVEVVRVIESDKIIPGSEEWVFGGTRWGIEIRVGD